MMDREEEERYVTGDQGWRVFHMRKLMLDREDGFVSEKRCQELYQIAWDGFLSDWFDVIDLYT